MSINLVQIQSGLSTAEITASCDTDAFGHHTPYRARWPNALRCQTWAEWRQSCFRCGQHMCYQRRVCRHQYRSTLLAGTLFEASKLAVASSVVTIHLRPATQTNLAALKLMRHLDVNYNTDSGIKQKAMQATTERENSRHLN